VEKWKGGEVERWKGGNLHDTWVKFLKLHAIWEVKAEELPAS